MEYKLYTSHRWMAHSVACSDTSFGGCFCVWRTLMMEILPIKTFVNQSGNLVLIQDESLIEVTPWMADLLIEALQSVKHLADEGAIGE